MATITAVPAGRTGSLVTTRRLLAAGVAAGPLYVGVSLAQALTREGFELHRHAWSMLSNGDLGWIQVTNFLVSGALLVAFAAGLARAGRDGRWAPRLVAVFGASLLGAGVFRADPGAGFPAGTPGGAAEISWHGMLHFLCGGIGFTALTVACLLVARRQTGRTAAVSRAAGILLLVTFLGMAASGGAPFGILGFVAGVVLVLAWLTALAAARLRSTR